MRRKGVTAQCGGTTKTALESHTFERLSDVARPIPHFFSPQRKEEFNDNEASARSAQEINLVYESESGALSV
jgi:hypothetical protein